MDFSVETIKQNKGMVAVLGVLLVACGVVLWMNLKGESTPPPKPVQIEQVAPTPELRKQYEKEQKIEQSRPVKNPAGA